MEKIKSSPPKIACVVHINTLFHSFPLLPTNFPSLTERKRKRERKKEMGNCQAIDNATLVIQHPSGRAEKFYWPLTASEVMKNNPGHFVALFLTTTTFRSPSNASAATSAATVAKPVAEHNNNNLVRVTRIKLLRPTDMLILGQVYRLVTNQEVMKGISAKKYAKMKKNQNEPIEKQESMKQKLDSEPINSETEKNKQAQKPEKHRSRTTKSANSAASKPRHWQPSLNSISESTS